MRYTNPRLLYYSWSTLRMCSVCRRRSVVRPSVRCLSRDHISKTEQVRPIVTMEQCPEVATVDSVAHSRPAKMPSWGDILVSNLKKKYLQIRPPVRLGVRLELLSSECDRRNLLLTTVVSNHRPLRLQHLRCDAEVEQKAGQLLFTVAILLLSYD